MGNVITGVWKPKEEIVFSCKECGNQFFWINEGGTVTCRACGIRQLVAVDWLVDACKITNETVGETIFDFDESDEDE